nr:MAG TPA: hypothetical protein [Caudoviricetes sp.]DAU07901.1 MAG TPA: hypothetical protein [Caudoviricetes sp.]DAY74066.1 MAG TPA: hypothetical protein [Caudoviricetes sp.]
MFPSRIWLALTTTIASLSSTLSDKRLSYRGL